MSDPGPSLTSKERYQTLGPRTESESARTGLSLHQIKQPLSGRKVKKFTNTLASISSNAAADLILLPSNHLPISSPPTAMAKFFAVFLLVLIAISMLQATVSANGGHRGGFGPGSLTSSQCPGQCIRRCSKTQYHKPCMFFCQKCCAKCLCVPPGFYGNKQVCPCYNNWKTKEGGPKCP
ncbi:hypothetical protein LXL04_013366 [Taraxacum kok-saghyz]